MEPELIKEILSKKFSQFTKPKSTPLAKFIAQGLAGHNGEKWAKHRKIINPAFALEKLQVVIVQFSFSIFYIIVQFYMWRQQLNNLVKSHLKWWVSDTMLNLLCHSIV